MATLVYSSKKHAKSESLSTYQPNRHAYILASKLIDSIILENKRIKRLSLNKTNVAMTQGKRTIIVKIRPH